MEKENRKKRVIILIISIILLLLCLIIIIGFSYIAISVKNEYPENDYRYNIIQKEHNDGSMFNPITFEQLPNDFVNAVLVDENETDYFENKTSFIKSIFSKKYSSITMKVVGKIFYDLEDSYIDNVKKAYISKYYFEKDYSKQDIFMEYISGTGFYNGISGVSDASKLYLNKNIDELSLSDSTFLASVLNSRHEYELSEYGYRHYVIDKYNPYLNLENVKERQTKILESMFKYKYIDNAQMYAVVNLNLKDIINTNIVIPTDEKYKYVKDGLFARFIENSDKVLKNFDSYSVTLGKMQYKCFKKTDSNGFVYEIYNDGKLLDSRMPYNLSFNSTKVISSSTYALPNETEKEYKYLTMISSGYEINSITYYNILIFDEKGNLLLSSDNTTSVSKDGLYDVMQHFLEYNYETKVGEKEQLDLRAKNTNNFCEYIKDNYKDDNYLVSVKYKYRLFDGNLEELEKNEITISEYKKKYGCN